MKPVEFRLGPGHLIRGRVVNPQGKPLDGVTVQAMNWKGHSSLDWTTKTDAQGRFTWDSAPAEPVLMTLTRPGFTMVGQREFQADRGETNVTMYPPLRVRGKVTDARTGQPIERFTLVHGSYHRFANQDGALRNINWEGNGPRTEFTGGKYEVEFSHPQVWPWPCGSRPGVLSLRRPRRSKWRPATLCLTSGSSPGSAHPESSTGRPAGPWRTRP